MLGGGWSVVTRGRRRSHAWYHMRGADYSEQLRRPQALANPGTQQTLMRWQSIAGYPDYPRRIFWSDQAESTVSSSVEWMQFYHLHVIGLPLEIGFCGRCGFRHQQPLQPPAILTTPAGGYWKNKTKIWFFPFLFLFLFFLSTNRF